MKKPHSTIPLACLRCHTPLIKRRQTLRCPRCQARYPIRRGLPYLFPPPVQGQNPSQQKYLFAYCDIDELTKTIPTPFFLTSEEILRNRATTFKNAFSAGRLQTRIYYSVKTSYDPLILATIQDMGFGAEVGSSLELEHARRAGFKAGNIIFDSPAKTDAELRQAVELGIGGLNIDSLSELRRLIRLTPKGKTVRLGVRLRSSDLVPHPFLNLARGKFGLDVQTLITRIPRLLRQHPNLRLRLLLAHLGSQITSPKPYKRLIARMLELRSTLAKRGIVIEEVNIGGGFPTRNLKPGPLKILATLLSGEMRFTPSSLDKFLLTINRWFREVTDPADRPILAAEPGRSIVSQAVILVTKVLTIKPDGWLILDASTNFLPEPSYFGKHPIHLARNPSGNPKIPYKLAGASLNTTDVIGLSVPLPRVKEADTLVIEEAGAYTLSRATQFTIPLPPVYWITSLGEIRQIRRRGTYADLIAPYNV